MKKKTLKLFIIAGIIGPILYFLLLTILGLLWQDYNPITTGMSKGRPYAVGLGRFLIIWMMIFTFLSGTIIGAIIWKRFSHPVAQKYLNYV